MSLKINQNNYSPINHLDCQPPKTIKNINQKNNINTKTPIYNGEHQEMPFYASSCKGSYTIEASIIMPLFITMMILCVFIFRVFQVQTGIQQSIDYASRTMAATLGNISNIGESDKDVEMKSEDVDVNTEVSKDILIGSTVALAQLELINRNVPLEFVDGGEFGINFLDSSVEGNYIDIKVNYTMTFPVGLLGNFSFDVSQRSRNRKWVGYDKAENTTDACYIYVTDHGEVYHSNINCTYLRPSVHRVAVSELAEKRNKGGGIYYECERCKNKSNNGFVFLTDYGTAYHNDASCTEIKHNIKKVSYDEVKDKMRPCSKCGEVH